MSQRHKPVRTFNAYLHNQYTHGELMEVYELDETEADELKGLLYEVEVGITFIGDEAFISSVNGQSLVG